MADAEIKQRVTLSGVSSGGYMAVQSHVALAQSVGGVAVIAGGPYDCAGGDISQALGPCMSGEGIDVPALRARTAQAAEAGKIAPVDAMENARAWIFHSATDGVVDPRVSVALQNFYAAYVPAENMRAVTDLESAHGWPTLNAGSACADQGGDFINACDYDAAGELLEFVYGGLADRVPAADPQRLREVDLSQYFASGSHVADTGYAYVPGDCEPGQADCRLHIAFHGCRQGAEFLGDRFASTVGLNEWAQTNRIIVVYPQVESSLMNPNGCWDWWGYTGKDYSNRDGAQVAGVGALIDAYAEYRLLGET